MEHNYELVAYTAVCRVQTLSYYNKCDYFLFDTNQQPENVKINFATEYSFIVVTISQNRDYNYFQIRRKKCLFQEISQKLNNDIENHSYLNISKIMANIFFMKTLLEYIFLIKIMLISFLSKNERLNISVNCRN